MTTRTHNADWTAEIDLPTQRYELRDTNRSGWCPYYQMVPLDYSPSADDPGDWCRAEDVAKLEARNAQLSAARDALRDRAKALAEKLREIRDWTCADGTTYVLADEAREGINQTLYGTRVAPQSEQEHGNG